MQPPPANGACIPHRGPGRGETASGEAAKALDYIDTLCIQFRLVDANFRGLGLGRILLERAQEEALLLSAQLSAKSVSRVGPSTQPRPYVVTTSILKLSRYGRWYEKELGFVPPRKYAIMQNIANTLFNQMWIPDHVRVQYFDVAEVPLDRKPQKTYQARRVLARPSRQPFATFDADEFADIYMKGMLLNRGTQKERSQAEELLKMIC
ncbi:unnamed protein product [Amoebophrya sp. A25]|nr:unnamed protein product [Amoebophrya sp. A25]|eukprot:GSA25T00009934001.1